MKKVSLIIVAAVAAIFMPNAKAACAYGQTCNNQPQYICVGSGGTAFTAPDGIICYWSFKGPHA